MKILKTVDLTKTYHNGEINVPALRGINMEIEKGRLTAIVGESGSGKSTLLHLLGGVDNPTGGQVLINDRDLYSMNENQISIYRRRNIGFVFQFFNLIPVLTAEENILLPYLLDNAKPDREYIGHIISVLGIEDELNHLPSQLSGGQQQRVSIARALAYKPAVVLADEPSGNLDSRNSREVLGLLRKCVETFDQTLVVVTHDEKISDAADRVIIIEDGLIKSDRKVRS